MTAQLTTTIESEFPGCNDETKTALAGAVGIFLWYAASLEVRELAINFARKQQRRLEEISR